MAFGFFACIAEELDFCLCPGWVAPRFLSSDCAALSFSFNGFEVDVSDPRGRVANASFLDLSELGFRWCLAFSHALPMSLIFVFVQAGLRYVFCTATALLSPSLLTVSKRTFRTHVEGLRTVFTLVLPSLLTAEEDVSDPCGRVANASFLGLSELGFRWRLAFSHALPRNLIDVCLCPGWVAPRFLPSDCPAFLFCNSFEADVSDPCGRVANASFSGLSELGFRWCLAFSHALSMSLMFVFVQAGLRHVFCPATALLSPSLLF